MHWMKLESYLGNAPLLPGTAGASIISLPEDVFFNVKTLGLCEGVGSDDNSLMGTRTLNPCSLCHPRPFRRQGALCHPGRQAELLPL